MSYVIYCKKGGYFSEIDFIAGQYLTSDFDSGDLQRAAVYPTKDNATDLLDDHVEGLPQDAEFDVLRVENKITLTK